MNMNIPDTIETRARRQFKVGNKLYAGDLADIYAGTYMNGGGSTSVVLKIGRDRRDNDLLENEISVLSHLYPPKQKDEKFFRYLPKIIDTAQCDGRHVAIMPFMEGYVSLAEILAAYPRGLDFRDMVWMYKRLLGGLGFAGAMGVVHGAVLPPHVIVHGEAHGAKILDWSYALNFAALLPATKVPDPDPQPTAKAPAKKAQLGVWDLLRQNLYTEDPPPEDPSVPNGPPPDPNKMYVKALSVDYEKFYAPEILRKETPSPATDIYMAAKCAVALLGGDVETNQLPDTVMTTDPESIDPVRARTLLQSFLQVSLLANPRKRPQDAWQVHEDFDVLLRALVGPPKYRKFTMPVKVATQ